MQFSPLRVQDHPQNLIDCFFPQGLTPFKVIWKSTYNFLSNPACVQANQDKRINTEVKVCAVSVYEPGAANDAGTEQHVDNWVCNAVQMSKALDEHGHVVFALSVVFFQETVDVEQVVDEVRTPAKYER